MKDILNVFDFKLKDFDEESIDNILNLLSKEEKKVFVLLANSSDALSATEVYDYYIDKLINEDPELKNRIKELKMMISCKKDKSIGRERPIKIKADFARGHKVKVPTNRTVTRLLENLKDSGFVVKRNTINNKAKAYYSLTPRLNRLAKDNMNKI